jgi:microcystin-dependent protein
MATFVEDADNFHAVVYSLATTDPVKGGAIAGAVSAPTDGYANVHGQTLADRTSYLKKRMNPIGEVLMYAGASAPYGYLVCNGAAISRTTYAELFSLVGISFGQGNGTTTFNTPDLRGRFVRMTDGGSGLDPDVAIRSAMATGGATGNNIGSVQADAFEAHVHDINLNSGIGSTIVPEAQINGTAGNYNTESTGGSETRPVNAYLNFIIKAYN